MNETSKNRRRRIANGDFNRYFVGRGIDIGCGKDPVLTTAVPFDKEHGDAHTLPGVPEQSFDWVYSSHCLEHLERPHHALERWWAVLRPGGHLILTVPDFVLYEKRKFPSRFNTDHKHFFGFQSLLDLFTMLEGCQLIRMQLNDEDFNYKDRESDQTRYGAQAEIEVIARKVTDIFWQNLQWGRS